MPRLPNLADIPYPRLRHALFCVALSAMATGSMALGALEQTDGVLVAPLDDTYIHLQYARSIGEGHPFRYHAGDAPSSGASSLVYVLLLAPFHLFLHPGAGMVLVALAFGTLAYGLGAFLLGEAIALAAGPRAKYPASILALSWGAFHWHVASGMEGALVFMMIAGTVRALFAHAREPDQTRAWNLVGWVLLGAFTRPELAPLGLLVAFSLGRGPQTGRSLRFGLTLLAPLWPRLFWWVLTGQSSTTGARNKWIPLMPYADREFFERRLFENLERGYMVLRGVDGDRFTEGHLPAWFGLGLLAFGIVFALLPKGTVPRTTRLAALLGILGGLALTLSYNTFPDHRFRYQAPLVAALLPFSALSLTAFTSRLRGPRNVLAWIGPSVAMLAALPMLGTHAAARESFAKASGEIYAQHHDMAAAIRALPVDARVAISDAGVLAYLGERPTIDVLGLTTAWTGPYFMLSGGAQLELIESRPPGDRPTHIVVYPRWWHQRAMLGRHVHVSDVPGPTEIVGDTVMTLYEVRDIAPPEAEAPHESTLRDGERCHDAIDLADVDSERAHAFELGALRWGDLRAERGNWFGERIWEGGRLTADWIEAAFDARVGYPVRLYVRATSPTPARFGVAVDDVIVGSLDIPGSRGRFVEVPVDLSSAVVRPGMRVRLTRREGEPVLLHLFACQRVER